ncbi:phosphopantetheine-binding protein [uncultured Campylobacter sp.]|uniref:phosphopantetheine-binding protein n=1 Tax=uncultured Campylobacter sp. TaxID=218934 RepID=UPI002616F7F7|nr:phosphopantetheine-binding protein [uncultured Campylobacter sp.]
MNEEILELKELIISGLNLEDVAPGDINDDEALFGDGLGLDSVDALELGLLVQKKYGIVLNSKTQNLKQIFSSVASLAQYIAENRSKNE